MDDAVGEITGQNPQATVLIVSNTGMGPNFSGMHLVPEILERLGMEKASSKRGGKLSLLSRLMPYRKWGAYNVKQMEKLVSAETIEKVKRIIPEKLWDICTRRFLTLGNNWENSRAFSVPNDFTGAIRINLKGREPRGLVEEGREYDELCDELRREFLALVNPETGKQAVSEVLKMRDIYQGENIDELPDLVVRWTAEDPIRSLTSPRIGTVTGEIPDKRTGAHKLYGFCIGAGNGIRKAEGLGEASIMDIGPTVLHLMGQPIPPDMDGKILLDILEEDFQLSSDQNPKI